MDFEWVWVRVWVRVWAQVWVWVEVEEAGVVMVGLWSILQYFDWKWGDCSGALN